MKELKGQVVMIEMFDENGKIVLAYEKTYSHKTKPDYIVNLARKKAAKKDHVKTVQILWQLF